MDALQRKIAEQAVSLLRAAAARIEPAYCADAFAKNRVGITVEPSDPSAVRWCTVGALQAETELAFNDALRAAYDRAIQALGAHLIGTGEIQAPSMGAIPDWNDRDANNGPHVAAAMRAAAAKLQAELDAVPDQTTQKLLAWVDEKREQVFCDATA